MPRRIRYDGGSPAAGRVTHRGEVSTWTGPWLEPGFTLCDLVASWHARTPGGSWIEVAAQAKFALAQFG